MSLMSVKCQVLSGFFNCSLLFRLGHLKEQTHRKERVMETGNFVLQGNQFIAGGEKFVFRKRKKATVNKPVDFLIQLTPSVRYVSSLFPAGEEGLYTFDHERQVYILKKEQGQVTIAEEG